MRPLVSPLFVSLVFVFIEWCENAVSSINALPSHQQRPITIPISFSHPSISPPTRPSSSRLSRSRSASAAVSTLSADSTSTSAASSSQPLNPMLLLNADAITSRYERLNGDDVNNTTTSQSRISRIVSRVAVAPLTGCASLTFTAETHVNGQGPFKLIVDSGSATTAVASSACQDCFVSPSYNPSASANSTRLSIAASGSYGDKSGWSGEVFTDLISVGSSPAIQLSFAAIEDQTNDFFTTQNCNGDSQKNNQQGILGLAFPPLALPGTDSFFTEFIRQTSLPNQWAIQMCSSTGNLWLGGYDPDFTASSFQYVPLSQQKYYNVYMTDLKLAGQSLGFSAKDFGYSSVNGRSDNVFVDSGTTALILPTTVFNALSNALYNNDAFVNAFGVGFLTGQYCISTIDDSTVEQLTQSLPRLQIVLAADAQGTDAITLDLIGVLSYVFQTSSSSTTGRPQFCPGIAASRGGSSILGYPVINQFTTLFDVGNNRIGFATTAKCGIEAPTFVWQTSDWSDCSQICGSGFQTRTVHCADPNDNVVSDAECLRSGSKPGVSQACNSQACSSTQSLSAIRIATLTLSPQSLSQGSSATMHFETTGGQSYLTAFWLQPLNNQQNVFPVPLATSTLVSGTVQFVVPLFTPVGQYQLQASMQTPSSVNAIAQGPTITITTCTTACSPVCSLSETLTEQCSGHGWCNVTTTDSTAIEASSDERVLTQCLCSDGWTGTRCEQRDVTASATTTSTSNVATVTTSSSDTITSLAVSTSSSCSLSCANNAQVNETDCSCECAANFAGFQCQYRYSTLSLVLNGIDVNQAGNDASFSYLVRAELSRAIGWPMDQVDIVSMQRTDVSSAALVSNTTNVNVSVVDMASKQSTTSTILVPNLITSSSSTLITLHLLTPTSTQDLDAHLSTLQFQIQQLANGNMNPLTSSIVLSRAVQLNQVNGPPTDPQTSGYQAPQSATSGTSTTLSVSSIVIIVIVIAVGLLLVCLFGLWCQSVKKRNEQHHTATSYSTQSSQPSVLVAAPTAFATGPPPPSTAPHYPQPPATPVKYSIVPSTQLQTHTDTTSATNAAQRPSYSLQPSPHSKQQQQPATVNLLTNYPFRLQLHSMGLINDADNIAALALSHNQLDRAIDLLLSNDRRCIEKYWHQRKSKLPASQRISMSSAVPSAVHWNTDPNEGSSPRNH